MSKKRKERCETCRFWEKGRSEGEHPDDQPGECHGHPPILNTEAIRRRIDDDIADDVLTEHPSVAAIEGAGSFTVWAFPKVRATEWCGEWQEK